MPEYHAPLNQLGSRILAQFPGMRPKKQFQFIASGEHPATRIRTFDRIEIGRTLGNLHGRLHPFIEFAQVIFGHSHTHNDNYIMDSDADGVTNVRVSMWKRSSRVPTCTNEHLSDGDMKFFNKVVTRYCRRLIGWPRSRAWFT